ncbi:MAG: hypothetical protein AAGA96_15520 [Verrucomicrobiota bacterium]
MDTTGYFIITGVLVILAAWMLYARFISRSREKSLHHAPLEHIGLEYTEVSFEDDSDSKSKLIEEDGASFEVRAQIISEVDSRPESSEEEEYLDDLQEAAAGLADLMRSSPVNHRAEPTVYEPGEAAQEETESSNLQKDSDADESLKTFAEEAEGESSSKVVEENSGIRESEVEVAATVQRVSEEVTPLLGEEVVDQFHRIDDGLDALEALVFSIESGIAGLDLESDEVAVSEDGVEAAA